MLSEADLTRYARQAILPELGEEGQERLLASRVLVIGAGGLGSPVIALLAAAGIGELTICDGDAVELSNLNRQFIHSSTTLGENKADQAASFASRLNPAIRTIAIPQMMNQASLADFLDGQPPADSQSRQNSWYSPYFRWGGADDWPAQRLYGRCAGP